MGILYNLIIMAHILNGCLIAFVLANIAIGYYRRQIGYKLMGEDCLQWRYVVKQLSQKATTMKATPQYIDSTSVARYRNFFVDLTVSLMSSLEKYAGKTTMESEYSSLGVIILNGMDSIVGFVAKLFIIFYAILRFFCSIELSTFDSARAQKWSDMPYDILRNRSDTRYRIVYIRHGESMWNKLFNRGLSFTSLTRIAQGLLDELIMATEMDSKILDSPLSSVGVDQASELSQWVLGSQFTEAYTDKCCFLSSNLRRALGTVLIGFGARIRNSNKIRVLSCLQELTRNPDSISYAFQDNTTPLEFFGTSEVPEQIVQMAAEKLNWQDNRGNRGLFDKIEHRFHELLQFCDNVYSQEGKKIFIISGHSLYLKKFLQFYLPPQCNEPGASKKISNCGIISFDMLGASSENGTRRHYGIDAKSVELVKGRYL